MLPVRFSPEKLAGVYPGLLVLRTRASESSIKLFSLSREREKEEEKAGWFASPEDSPIFALFAAAAETRPRLFTGRLIASSRRSSSSLVGFPRESLLEEGWKNDVEKRMVRRERGCERKRRVGYFHYLVCLIPERFGHRFFLRDPPFGRRPLRSTSHRTAPCLSI